MDFMEFQKKERNKIMPSSEKFASMAQQHTSINKDLVEEKFNQYLRELLWIEFDLYKQYERECSTQIIQKAIKTNFLKDVGTLHKSLNENYDALWNFFLSISQSRKARAGSSFEKHVKFLFELLEYPFDTQTILNGKVDYVIPSKAAFQKNRIACVVISIKRTLRERWRQVVGELASTNAGKIYILTADDNISYSKVEVIKRHNVNLVVWDELKASRFKDYHTVYGFTSFVKTDLPSSKKLWQHLI